MLMNYVELQDDIPLRLHFTDDYYIKRRIADTERGGTKIVESLVFWVDSVGGEPTAKTFSVLSTKLVAKLQPYLKDQLYQKFDFIITRRGSAYAREFTVEAIPRD